MKNKINKYEKVLQMCCGEEKIHWSWMKSPFTIDDYGYATDSIMMIKIPNSIIGNTYEAHKDVPMAKIPEMFNITPTSLYYLDTQKLQKVLESLPLVDEMSEGKECLVCEGDGEVECPHCGSAIDCEECGGSGYTETPKPTDCKIPKGSVIKIGEICFSSKYLLKIMRITNTLEFKATIRLSIQSPSLATIFKIHDLCEILLMPAIGSPDVEIVLE